MSESTFPPPDFLHDYDGDWMTYVRDRGGTAENNVWGVDDPEVLEWERVWMRPVRLSSIGHKTQHAGWIVSGDDFIEKVEHVPDGCAKCEAVDALAELEQLAADAQRVQHGHARELRLPRVPRRPAGREAGDDAVPRAALEPPGQRPGRDRGGVPLRGDARRRAGVAPRSAQEHHRRRNLSRSAERGAAHHGPLLSRPASPLDKEKPLYLISRSPSLTMPIRAGKTDYVSTSNLRRDITLATDDDCSDDFIVLTASEAMALLDVVEAAREVMRRESVSEYSSIYAAPSEFAALLRPALNRFT